MPSAISQIAQAAERRHDVVVAPELRGGARQRDGKEIDGEPDGGEQHRGFRGLAERGRKARVDGEPDDGEAERGKPSTSARKMRPAPRRIGVAAAVESMIASRWCCGDASRSLARPMHAAMRCRQRRGQKRRFGVRSRLMRIVVVPPDLDLRAGLQGDNFAHGTLVRNAGHIQE